MINIHCSNILEFGGIGSIARAQKKRAYYQRTAFNQVTETIDKGIVFDTEAYGFDPTFSDCANEEHPCAASIGLLLLTLQQLVTSATVTTL